MMSTTPNNPNTNSKGSSQLQHLSNGAETIRTKLEDFVNNSCIPAESEYEDHIDQFHGQDRWKAPAVPPCMDRLKREAREIGLWNLFLPNKHPLPENLRHLGPSIPNLSVREYGVLCEIMGRSALAPEACNCSAPDTGNMEVLLQFGSPSQQHKWLGPLLDGRIRSAFLMTEPDVASSDATNIECQLTKIIDGSNNNGNGPQQQRVKYVLNGKKWWSTGAMDPRCKVAIVLARMDYSHPSCRAAAAENSLKSGKPVESSKHHGGHTMVVIPMDAPGVKLVRPLTVFGYDDAPHGHAEVALEDVELASDAILLGEGRGFTIAQARLGPGRVHHCMRAVGLAARCYELMLERSMSRQTFGKFLCEHGSCQEMIADSATDVNMARLMTLSCAAAIDAVGANMARDKIAMIKFAVPELTSRVVDRAVQVHGGAGVCSDFPLARALAGLRTLRIADGPDIVHKRTVALLEIKRMAKHMGLEDELRQRARSRL